MTGIEREVQGGAPTLTSSGAGVSVAGRTAANMQLLFRVFPMFFLVGLIQGEECLRLRPANGLDVGQVLGTWYAIRGLEHSTQSNSTNSKQTKSCPVIKILSKGEKIIEFQWNAKDKPQKKIELKINRENPGYLELHSKKGQKGSFRSLQISTHGTMRNVIGITMCKSGGKLASVILNREPNFAENEAKLLTNDFASQGLAVSNAYDRCIK